MSHLTIVGASVRAGAASARRAGLDPWCADLFADADLRAMVPAAVRCPPGQYPHGLLDILRDAPPGPWMYTGGLENHPNLIRRMAEVRPLWGNGPNALVASRSPFTIECALREAGLPMPEVRGADAELPGYCRWLRKPLAGAAGRGIAFAAPGPAEPPSGGRRPRHYYQQFVPGPSLSAVFVRTRDDLRLLGVTEQLIGPDWLDAPPFRYAGNIGPVPLSDEFREDLMLIGRTVAERCGLLGLFGVDFIHHRDRPWVVEVNPRYPASVEVLELATGVRAIASHRLAFDPEARPVSTTTPAAAALAKGILYARKRLVMQGAAVRTFLDANRPGGPWFVDVPPAGEVIEPGWPILTVLAPGSTPGAAANSLVGWSSWARSSLGITQVPRRPGSWYDRLDDPESE